MTPTPPVVLAIAATDSGGGAGLAADLATFAALDVHGTLVVTAVTAQDTKAVTAIHAVPAGSVAAQLDAVLGDLPPAVVKTGMLGSASTVRLVAERCAGLPLVVDPVLRASSGAELGDAAVVRAYREHLLPAAIVVTPNAAEARALLGLAADDATSARDLAIALVAALAGEDGQGPAVVLTGGPAPGEAISRALSACTNPAAAAVEIGTSTESTGTYPHATGASCIDWLALPDGAEPTALAHAAVDTANDHGTGCTFAAALAAHLAHGDDLSTAARRAAAYVSTQLQISSTWDLGAGRGPIAHTHPTPELEEIPA